MLSALSRCVSVIVIWTESLLLRKVDIGVDVARPVKAVIGATLLRCSDGALFIKLCNMGTI